MSAQYTVLFSGTETFDGMLSDLVFPYCDAVPQSFGCVYIEPFVAFDNGVNWFDPPFVAAAVQAPNGDIIAANWTELMRSGVTETLGAAGVVASAWWSGLGPNGLALTNCANWTSNGGDTCELGKTGSASQLRRPYLSESIPCGNLTRVVCICVGGLVTRTPSASPSNAPFLPVTPTGAPGF